MKDKRPNFILNYFPVFGFLRIVMNGLKHHKDTAFYAKKQVKLNPDT
jgi:hypothetical protein